ncbi:MAG: type II secretion system protein N, partial [Litorimonas sp.]
GGVSDLVLGMPIARLPISDQRLAGLSGRLSLRVDEAVIEDGACLSASGSASTDVLAANRARFDWTGPELSGPVDCVDGRLRVRLSGQDAAQQVEATVLTGFDGMYRTDISVSTRDPMAGNVLTLFGFAQDRAGSYTLSEQGQWR